MPFQICFSMQGVDYVQVIGSKKFLRTVGTKMGWDEGPGRDYACSTENRNCGKPPLQETTFMWSLLTCNPRKPLSLSFGDRGTVQKRVPRSASFTAAEAPKNSNSFWPPRLRQDASYWQNLCLSSPAMEFGFQQLWRSFMHLHCTSFQIHRSEAN